MIQEFLNILMFWKTRKPTQQAVKEIPRNLCAHGNSCYLCPRGICRGVLNDPNDPDLAKPRVVSFSTSVVIQGSNGIMHMKLTRDASNERARLRAAKEQEGIDPAAWKEPGYDPEEVLAILRAFDRDD